MKQAYLQLGKESYIAYNQDGHPTGILQKEQRINRSREQWLKAVTCFVVNPKGEVLQEIRQKTAFQPEQKDLCSGHLEGRETPIMAMTRELQEELGIGIEQSYCITKLTPISIQQQFESKNFFVDYFYLPVKQITMQPQKEEIDQIQWIPLPEMIALLKNGQTRFPNTQKDQQFYDQMYNQIQQIRNCKNNTSIEK